MRLRLAALAAAAVAVIFTGGAAWGDPADNRGIEQACSGPANDKNPHCNDGERPGGGRSGADSSSGSGGRGNGGTTKPPNEPGPSMGARLAACGADADEDGKPDGCDFEDRDDDGVPDQFDNCSEPNNAQTDSDGDGIGDPCDPYPYDSDHDGIDDGADNCPNDPNPDQANNDGDDEGGDVCDGDDYNGEDNDRPDEFDEARAGLNDFIDEVQSRVP
jgi:hypothetical protein